MGGCEYGVRQNPTSDGGDIVTERSERLRKRTVWRDRELARMPGTPKYGVKWDPDAKDPSNEAERDI